MQRDNPLQNPAQRFLIYSLFNAVWPGLGSAIPKAAGAGACWHDVSQAFVKWVGGRPVSHAGVIEIPMVIDGQEVKVGAIHAVCTLKDQRKQGYNRECMEQALAYCDQRYSVCQLLTDRPVLYERYGFKSYPFVNYCYSLERTLAKAEGSLFQRIDPSSPTDLARLHDGLQKRTPVSQRIASRDPGWLLLIDEVLEQRGIQRISYCEDIDAHLVYEIKGSTLHLLDVITSQWIDFKALMERIPEDFNDVVLYFTPDRWPGEKFQSQDFDEWVYMVRGPFSLKARDFCYPRLAES